MKLLLSFVCTLLVSFAAPVSAKSDADVTHLKATRVVIREDSIEITVTEAKTRITLIRGEHDPEFEGDTWMGMPVTRVEVVSGEAIFTIRRPPEAAEGRPLADAWRQSLDAARDLQAGKMTGRIGYYAPDIVIRRNRIATIDGFGFLFPVGK